MAIAPQSSRLPQLFSEVLLKLVQVESMDLTAPIIPLRTSEISREKART